MVNLLLALVLYRAGKFSFSAVNCALGLFELCPLPSLDGGQALFCLMQRYFCLRTAQKFCTVVQGVTVLVVLAARDNTNRVYDGSCVMSNLMNAAKAVGLASCWVHRAKEVFDSEEGKALLRQWGVEGDYEGIGHCILGYRADTAPAPAPRKEHYIYRVR